MSTVTSHDDPTPTIRMQSNHDWYVGRGSRACHLSKANAAATETMNCSQRTPYRSGKGA